MRKALCVVLVACLAGSALADPPTHVPPPCNKPIAKAVAVALLIGFVAGLAAADDDCPPASPFRP